jgi:hypothetical protein
MNHLRVSSYMLATVIIFYEAVLEKFTEYQISVIEYYSRRMAVKLSTCMWCNCGKR